MSRVAFPLLALLALPAAGRAAPEPPRLVLETGGHTGRVKGVFFTPGGKELVSVGEDKTIRLWNLAGGEATRVLRLPLGPADRPGGEVGLSAAMTPDGKWLAVAGPAPVGQEFWVYLIDLPAGTVARVIKVGKERLWAVALSADGKWLACGGNGTQIPVYDAATGERKWDLAGPGRLRVLAFSPDGKRLAGGGLDKAVHLWDVEAGGPGKTLTGHTGWVAGLAWSPDGRMLASKSPVDRTLILWDAAAEARRNSVRADHGGFGVVFSADPGKVLVGGTLLELPRANGRLRPVASLRADLARADPDDPTGDDSDATQQHGLAVALSPDGRTAAFGSRDGIYLWFPAPPPGKTARPDPVRLGGRGHPVGTIAWSAAEDAVAWGAGDKPDREAFHLTDLRRLDPADGTWTGAAHVRGDLTLKPAGDTGVHTRLSVLKGADTVHTLDTGGEAINAYTFVGDRFAAAGTPFALRLFDLGTGKLARAYRDVGAVRAVAGAPGGDLFASGGLDQVVRVWSPDQPHPLLSVYAAGGEWVAWTPRGHYAASPGGERLVGWQVNAGYDQFATFHPAARFRKSLYRPDVVALVVKTKNVGKAVEEANRAAKKPAAAAATVEDLLPPRVAVVSPGPAPTTVRGAKVTVKAVAEGTGGRPVTSLRLMLDGRPYPGDGGLYAVPNPAPGTVEHEWAVDLPEGTHRVAVLAESAVSRATSTPVEVTRTPDPGGTAGAGKPGLYVLAVGINAYSGDWKLRCAVNDAEGLCRTFREKSGGLFRVETKVVTDAAATRVGILASMAWLKERMTPADTAVVFFAGHGQTDATGRFYLQPVDWDPDDLGKTCITGPVLQKYFGELPGRVFLVLDCCHSQAAAADKILTRTRPARTDALVRTLRDEEVAIGVWVSAQGSEFAQEKRDLGHGLFTLAMIDGLSGAADYNGDGEVYLPELDLYVTEQVRQRSGRKQTPALSRPLAAPFALSQK